MIAAALATIALLLLVAFSPVAAGRVAGLFESLARELRHHGGAMAGAYACYRNLRREFDRAGAGNWTPAARERAAAREAM